MSLMIVRRQMTKERGILMIMMIAYNEESIEKEKSNLEYMQVVASQVKQNSVKIILERWFTNFGHVTFFSPRSRHIKTVQIF